MAINKLYLNHIFLLPLHTDHQNFQTTSGAGKLVTAPAGAEAARLAIVPKSNSYAVVEGHDSGLVWPTGDSSGFDADCPLLDLTGSDRQLTLVSNDDSMVFVDWYRFNAISYNVGAVTFDGSTTYLSKTGDLDGAVDSPKMFAAFWVKKNGNDNNFQFFLADYDLDITIACTPDNNIRVDVTDTNGNIFYGDTTDTFTISNPFTLIMVSVDITNFGTPIVHVTFNDTVMAFTPILNNLDTGVIEFTNRAGWRIGAGNGGNNKFDGDMSMAFFKIGVAPDLSDVTFRRKFIDVTGLPVNLGANGELPFGEAPDIYMTQLATDTVAANFAVNLGTGGDFDITGALTLSTASPTNQ